MATPICNLQLQCVVLTDSASANVFHLCFSLLRLNRHGISNLWRVTQSQMWLKARTLEICVDCIVRDPQSLRHRHHHQDRKQNQKHFLLFALKTNPDIISLTFLFPKLVFISNEEQHSKKRPSTESSEPLLSHKNTTQNKILWVPWVLSILPNWLS